ncbi:LysE family translocator [Pelomonas sp. PFR6]|uniref:LysE family translocator n=2 Tax=Roseateles violae TaxID=3058042 RepID=A0ABT8DUN7_9BURK|nr:LysE family translocator [Pelomonas sp. PFR6]
MSTTELLPLMSYCLLMSGTPGPNNVLLTAAGANYGYRPTLPQILGTNSGVAALTWLSCLGLGQLFAAWPPAQQGLRIAGALYLLWLAWRLTGNVIVCWRAAPASVRRPARPRSRTAICASTSYSASSRGCRTIWASACARWSRRGAAGSVPRAECGDASEWTP